MAWIRSDAQGCIIETHVLPNGRKNEIVGLYNDRLKIKIEATPVDGKANICLLRFLAEVLNIKSSALELIKGDTSRQKQIKIHHLDSKTVETLIFKRTTAKD